MIGESCMVQNYVDRDPAGGASDFRCGHLTYDGHKGTDFRLRDLVQMRRGVAVTAAAAGTVVGARDSMPDVNVRQVGVAALNGRDCGNGVRIDHDGGWATQYCHMRRGSVRVKPGDQVRVGQQLGSVGLSGRTEFPHLHFEVTFRGRTVDPFVGPVSKTGCGIQERPLWRGATSRGLDYRGIGLIDAGFAGRRPTVRGIEEGHHRAARINGASDALVFWVRVFGLRPGDRQQLIVQRPDGSVLVKSEPKSVDRPKAVWMSFTGKPRPKAGVWPAGTYRGSYVLTRNGKTMVSVNRSIELR